MASGASSVPCNAQPRSRTNGETRHHARSLVTGRASSAWRNGRLPKSVMHRSDVPGRQCSKRCGIGRCSLIYRSALTERHSALDSGASLFTAFVRRNETGRHICILPSHVRIIVFNGSRDVSAICANAIRRVSIASVVPRAQIRRFTRFRDDAQRYTCAGKPPLAAPPRSPPAAIRCAHLGLPVQLPVHGGLAQTACVARRQRFPVRQLALATAMINCGADTAVRRDPPDAVIPVLR